MTCQITKKECDWKKCKMQALKISLGRFITPWESCGYYDSGGQAGDQGGSGSEPAGSLPSYLQDEQAQPKGSAGEVDE